MTDSKIRHNSELKQHKPWYLEVNFFHNLEERQKTALEQNAVYRAANKGSVLCSLDDPCEYIHVIRNGKVKIFLLTPEGDEIILGIRKPGNIIGLTAIFGWPRRVSYVAALEETEYMSIKVEFMRKLVESDVKLAIRLIGILGARLHHSRMLIEDLASKNVAERLARLLYNLLLDVGHQTAGGHTLDLTLTHEQIAQMIASTRQTVTSLLKEFEAMGMIRKAGKIIIADKSALESFFAR